jgi:tight adherence protein B
VTEYLLLHIVLLAAGAGAGYGLLHSLPTALLVAAFLLPLPHLYVGSVKARRLQAFAQQLPNALTSLANALRGGYGIAQAMSLTAEEMTPPMSTELRRVVAETGYGLPYDTAFRNMLRRNPSDDLSLVVTALELHLEMGGNLSEILDNIGAIVRDRVRIYMQVQALTASQRFSATIVTALPFGIVAVMYVLNRSYISQLWTTTPGLIILALAVVLVVTGTIVLRRVATIKV